MPNQVNHVASQPAGGSEALPGVRVERHPKTWIAVIVKWARADQPSTHSPQIRHIAGGYLRNRMAGFEVINRRPILHHHNNLYAILDPFSGFRTFLVVMDSWL